MGPLDLTNQAPAAAVDAILESSAADVGTEDLLIEALRLLLGRHRLALEALFRYEIEARLTLIVGEGADVLVPVGLGRRAANGERVFRPLRRREVEAVLAGRPREDARDRLVRLEVALDPVAAVPYSDVDLGALAHVHVRTLTDSRCRESLASPERLLAVLVPGLAAAPYVLGDQRLDRLILGYLV